MPKIWKQGDHISYETLNELQRKADAYDKLVKEPKKPDKSVEKEKKVGGGRYGSICRL